MINNTGVAEVTNNTANEINTMNRLNLASAPWSLTPATVAARSREGPFVSEGIGVGAMISGPKLAAREAISLSIGRTLNNSSLIIGSIQSSRT